jgi:hypothetical protein
MTKLKDVLAEADPLRHERQSPQTRRDHLRSTVLTAASDGYAPVDLAAAPRALVPPRRARHPMVVPLLVTFAAIVIGMVIIASMWSHSGSLAQAAVRFEVRLAEDQPAPGLRAARVGSSNRTIYLHPEIVVTNDDIERSSVMPGNTPGRSWIDVRLNAAGAEKMRQATMNHLGRPVAILIDADVVTAPTLKSPIGAAAVISGDYTQADAQRIAGGMRGAAP